MRGYSIPHQIEPLLLRSSVTLLLGTSAGEERMFCRRLELPRKPDFYVPISDVISASHRTTAHRLVPPRSRAKNVLKEFCDHSEVLRTIEPYPFSVPSGTPVTKVGLYPYEGNPWRIRVHIHHRHSVSIVFKTELELVQEILGEVDKLVAAQLKLSIDMVVKILRWTVRECWSGSHGWDQREIGGRGINLDRSPHSDHNIIISNMSVWYAEPWSGIYVLTSLTLALAPSEGIYPGVLSMQYQSSFSSFDYDMMEIYKITFYELIIGILHNRCYSAKE